MKNKALLAACMALLLALSACAQAKSYWRTTRTTISPDPEVDLANYNFDNPSERKLASLLTPVDAQLTGLMRFIETQDYLPEQDWLDLVMLRFPWLNGILVSDSEGRTLAQRPTSDTRRYDVSSLIGNSTDWRTVKYRTAVAYADLGPEMYIGRPYFENTEWKGLVVVHFDPRALLNACPRPNQLVIVHPGHAVWTDAPVDRQAVLNLPWTDMLASDVSGKLTLDGKPYTWFARFVADQQIVYMSESVVDQNKDKSYFFGLF